VRTLARLTAIIFMLVGLVAVVGGAYMFPREVSAPAPVNRHLRADVRNADFSALLFPLRLLVAGSLALQGLMLVAAGRGSGWWLTSSARASRAPAPGEPGGTRQPDHTVMEVEAPRRSASSFRERSQVRVRT